MTTKELPTCDYISTTYGCTIVDGDEWVNPYMPHDKYGFRRLLDGTALLFRDSPSEGGSGNRVIQSGRSWAAKHGISLSVIRTQSGVVMLRMDLTGRSERRTKETRKPESVLIRAMEVGDILLIDPCYGMIDGIRQLIPGNINWGIVQRVVNGLNSNGFNYVTTVINNGTPDRKLQVTRNT